MTKYSDSAKPLFGFVVATLVALVIVAVPTIAVYIVLSPHTFWERSLTLVLDIVVFCASGAGAAVAWFFIIALFSEE